MYKTISSRNRVKVFSKKPKLSSKVIRLKKMWYRPSMLLIQSSQLRKHMMKMFVEMELSTPEIGRAYLNAALIMNNEIEKISGHLHNHRYR